MGAYYRSIGNCVWFGSEYLQEEVLAHLAVIIIPRANH